MSTPSPETRPPLRLIDLSAFLANPANFPHIAPASLERLRLACRSLFTPDRIDPTTRLDALEIGALSKALADADPGLEPATLRTYERSAAAAIYGLRASLAPPVHTYGTVADLPVFLKHASERGQGHARTTANDIYAVRRVLRDLPDLADQDVSTLDLEKVARRFTDLNPEVKQTTVKAYLARLQHAITAYTTPPIDEPADAPTDETEPAAPTRPTTPAHAPRPHPAATSTAETEHLAVPLPGGRAVSLRTPNDLTGEEAAATGALLRLSHPAMFTPVPTPAAAQQPDPGGGRCCSGPNTPRTRPRPRT